MAETDQDHDEETSHGFRLLVCVNYRPAGGKPSCAGRGSERLADLLEQGIAARGLNVTLERSCCLGQCTRGPAMRLAPGGAFRREVTETDLPALLDELEATCGRRDDRDADLLPAPGT